MTSFRTQQLQYPGISAEMTFCNFVKSCANYLLVSPSHPRSVNSSLTALQHWQSGRGSCLKKGVVTPGEMYAHIFSTFQRWGSVCM